MDFAAEQTHATLVEVGLPSTIADLTNPTEEYMLALATQFLNKLNIDVNSIRKPTLEQLDLSLAEDNPEILGVINLSQAMASICSKIFINDFHLMDIMSPVPKRSRKTAKFLANYLLYAINKEAEIDERMEQKRLEQQKLQELRNSRMALKEAKNAQALRIAKKLEMKEQLEAEIEKLKMRKEGIKSRRDEAERNLKAAEEEKVVVAQRHKNLTAQALKIRKDVDEISSKIVRSPDRHNAQLRHLLEEKQQQSDKREVIQDALKSKRPSIQQFENSLSIVRQTHANLHEITEAIKCCSESKKKLEEKQKEVAHLKKRLVEEESTGGTDKGEQANNAALEEAKAQCEEHISAIRRKEKELSTEKKNLEKKHQESQTHLQELLSKRDEIQASTVKEETEIKKYLKHCQELYDWEITQIRETKVCMEKTLEKNLEKKH